MRRDQSAGRVAALRGRLVDLELDGVVITTPENIRYLSGFSGSLGYLVNNGMFAFYVHVLGIDYRVASVLAFLVSVTHNFVWSRHWTFQAAAEKTRQARSRPWLSRTKYSSFCPTATP